MAAHKERTLNDNGMKEQNLNYCVILAGGKDVVVALLTRSVAQAVHRLLRNGSYIAAVHL